MELILKPGDYINQVGKKSRRYFTFKLISETARHGIWRTEKYVPDMYFYEPDHNLDVKFLLNSPQLKYRKTKICEIFDFEVSKIKFYNGIEIDTF